MISYYHERLQVVLKPYLFKEEVTYRTVHVVAVHLGLAGQQLFYLATLRQTEVNKSEAVLRPIQLLTLFLSGLLGLDANVVGFQIHMYVSRLVQRG